MAKYHTLCCGEPIEGVRSINRIRTIEHPPEDEGDRPTYGSNAYCCQDLETDPREIEQIGRAHV